MYILPDYTYIYHARLLYTKHIIYIYVYTIRWFTGFIDLFFAWVMKKKYDNNNKIKYSHGTYKQDRYGKKTVIFFFVFFTLHRDK